MDSASSAECSCVSAEVGKSRSFYSGVDTHGMGDMSSRICDSGLSFNQAAMRLFEKCINTNDLELGRKLIADTAAFDTPVSPTPLYGAEGYLSVVSLMRKSFPDVQWKLVDMVADEKTVAVQWECSGTFSGEAPFAGLQPNGRRFSTTVMNFYSFELVRRRRQDIQGRRCGWHRGHPARHRRASMRAILYAFLAATSTRIQSRIPTDTTISERTAHTPTGIPPPNWSARSRPSPSSATATTPNSRSAYLGER